MDFNPHHLKILPDLEDFELKKGYMRALIQFAEDGVIRDDESDADSVVSMRLGARGGNGNTLAPEKAYISCRISSVPAFTWPVDEALQAPNEPPTADTDSILSASTTQSPGPFQDTFASLTLTTSRELNPPHLTALRPPPHPSRKKPTNPLPLLTVQEEPPRRSLSATSSPIQPHLAPPPPGRRSTSTTTTTPSSSSLSASSRRHGPKSLRSTSPRRSTSDSLLRLFRPSTSTATTAPLERRTLTPHDRLAPVPRQETDPESIPPVPVIDRSWEAVTIPPQIDLGQGSCGVFGIPLDESVALAPMRIRVSHKGSSVSHRSVPVSVYKSAEFIRRTAPHCPGLFGEATKRDRGVAGLYDLFNSSPGYGTDFSFPDIKNAGQGRGQGEDVGGGYTPADAAHLILLYLESLPKPLIPPSVVKSWIVLARRHARPGGVMEEEETLDLWSEALNRLGTMERNLVKLLLEVFAVVLGGAEAGGEEERGLAADVAAGMFHLELGGEGEGVDKGGGLLRRISSGRRGRKKEGRGREAVAALGFLVRRRGEYLGGLSKGGNAGGSGEGGFLPSVGEVMGWKGEGRRK